MILESLLDAVFVSLGYIAMGLTQFPFMNIFNGVVGYSLFIFSGLIFPAYIIFRCFTHPELNTKAKIIWGMVFSAFLLPLFALAIAALALPANANNAYLFLSIMAKFPLAQYFYMRMIEKNYPSSKGRKINWFYILAKILFSIWLITLISPLANITAARCDVPTCRGLQIQK